MSDELQLSEVNLATWGHPLRSSPSKPRHIHTILPTQIR